jgi:ParB family chromosome partitioning protein
VEGFLDRPLTEGLALREARAQKLLELDDAVVKVVDELKRKGFESAYLKNFVVARINPLRFQRGATGEFDPVIGKMLAAAQAFDASRVKKEDLAKMGGAPAEPEE